MQVRQILLASFLAVAAAGAMAQEIDRAETLQAKSLAARQMHAESSEGRTHEFAVTESRQVQASGEIKVGERADGLPVAAAPKISWAKWRTNQDYAQAWLHGDRRQARKVLVADHD